MPEDDYLGEVHPLLKRDPIRVKPREELRWTKETTLIAVFSLAFMAIVIIAMIAASVSSQPFVITK